MNPKQGNLQNVGQASLPEMPKVIYLHHLQLLFRPLAGYRHGKAQVLSLGTQLMLMLFPGHESSVSDTNWRFFVVFQLLSCLVRSETGPHFFSCILESRAAGCGDMEPVCWGKHSCSRGARTHHRVGGYLSQDGREQGSLR